MFAIGDLVTIINLAPEMESIKKIEQICLVINIGSNDNEIICPITGYKGYNVKYPPRGWVEIWCKHTPDSHHVKTWLLESDIEIIE
tara:strand:+ start:6486 stop:6743 length:258 start_codon:yes stop_codon:yes gene_type:complete